MQYIVPTHHYLESWGDAEPKSGLTSFLQPTIYPLFKTRPFQTSLLKWSGNNTDYDTYFKNYWTTKLGPLKHLIKRCRMVLLKQRLLQQEQVLIAVALLLQLLRLLLLLKKAERMKWCYTKKFLLVQVLVPLIPGYRNCLILFLKPPGTTMQ